MWHDGEFNNIVSHIESADNVYISLSQILADEDGLEILLLSRSEGFVFVGVEDIQVCRCRVIIEKSRGIKRYPVRERKSSSACRMVGDQRGYNFDGSGCRHIGKSVVLVYTATLNDA